MVSSEKSPAFQFYPRDFLADGDQAAMTLEEVGAYTRMLSYSWLKLGLDNDRPRIARMIGGSETIVEGVLREHFKLHKSGDEERWVNPRQEEERRKQRKHRKQQRLAGLKSAAARQQRALNERSSDVATDVLPKSNSSSSSASASASTNTEGRSADADSPAPARPPFADFWAAWPDGHRVGRKQAETQWARLMPDDCDTAIADVQWRVEHQVDWQHPRDDGRWAIPHPFRYLRDRRFMDARTVARPAPAKDLRAQAVALRDKAWGRCLHEDRCESREVCVQRITRDLAEQEKGGGA